MNTSAYAPASRALHGRSPIVINHLSVAALQLLNFEHQHQILMSDSATSTTASLTSPTHSSKHIGLRKTPSRPSSISSKMGDNTEPRLLISIDIGTSQSAVAVYYSKPGKVERASPSHAGLTPYMSRCPPPCNPCRAMARPGRRHL